MAFEVPRSLGPILVHAITSGELMNAECEVVEADPDVWCSYDVKIPIDSEAIELTANIFRSKKLAKEKVKVPVIMCAHPYDNSKLPKLKRASFGVPQQYRLIPQNDGKPKFSDITSWESPDPNFWVQNGYALVNLNLPGYGSSGGKPSVLSYHQSKCYYEAIEYIGAQPWCTGSVGLNGVSFLAISQFHVAACKEYNFTAPPCLKCISPWEGLTDMYRDLMCCGGVREKGFPAFWWATEVKPVISSQDAFLDMEKCLPLEYLEKHPLFDEFWQEKAAQVQHISIPMLACSSFSDHNLHTQGTFRGYERAPSKNKWIYTHRGGKWVEYYKPQVQQLTLRFMNHFLKGIHDPQFAPDTPRCRLEVRSSKDEIYQIRDEADWPIPRTQFTKVFLNAQHKMTMAKSPKPHTSVEYDADHGYTTFTYTFDQDTELTGYFKVRIHFEASHDDDGCIFAVVDKLDKDGKVVHFYGSVGTEKDPVSRGYQKISHRELDPTWSTESQPVYAHTNEHKLKKGDIVQLDVAMFPQATFFYKNESVKLTLASYDIAHSAPYHKISDPSHRKGKHIIHLGDKYDSYLLLPIIPPISS
uniref:Xaa-Pro dipeptidyl-peptidase C-terminal domain-containing protein n=1 Tax=Aureoumbra lagunensis TaxID=44058 RepID=A0A7S3NPE5_9STRA|mmetsp:Transcript_8989/g.13826  ORF Transcript_8989/g.13826 Transcript_8989/m.13826 type:complete len:584 (-) Transcript_8989:620-2371(-)